MNISKYNNKYNPLYLTKSHWDKDKTYWDKEHIIFYNSSRWKRLRDLTLRAHPLCIRCKRTNRLVSATTVDHLLVFKTRDDPLATDNDNLYSLCHTCHAIVTNRENYMKYRWLSMYEDGIPLDTIAKDKYQPIILSVDEDGYPLQSLSD